jgi:DNA recombination protein RmuC
MIYITLLILFLVAAAAAVYYQYRSSYSSLVHILELKEGELEDAKYRLDGIYEENVQLRVNVSALETEKKELITRLKEKDEEILNAQSYLTLQFNKIATDLLEEKSTRLVTENKSNIESILAPLKQKITDFENQVYNSSKESAERHVELRTEVKNLHELNERVTQEANDLTKAIKGDTRIQGVWGEMILERVLENAGLVKDREYFVQKSFRADNDRLYRPDIMIKLPNEKSIIVDSKVSLVSYERCVNSKSDDDKRAELRNYLLSLRNHINGLSKKSYQVHYEVNGLDFVLMFIPIESAFSLAMRNDTNIFNYAYENNIVLVSPLTLLATVRTISNIWQTEHQNRNALEIARQGGSLYDKFVAFTEDLNKIGKQLNTTQSVYSEAVKKLYDGRDCLVTKAEKIRQLGAKTSKRLELKGAIDFDSQS